MNALQEYLRDHPFRGPFRPGVHNAPWGDYLTVWLEDVHCVAETFAPGVTVYRCAETGRVVGVKVAGIKQLAGAV